MARADVMVFSGAKADNRNGVQSAYIVKTPTGIFYSFYIFNDNVFYYAKSTDNGFTWSDPVTISSTGVNQNFSVWYDKWTPGSTGTLIHLGFIENTTDDVLYRSLDTNGDSLGTQTTIFAGASAGATVASSCIAITRAIGGNLYCLFDIDAGTETGFYRSVDVGANWTSRTDANEGATDYYLLAPGFAADTQDIICIFWDKTADEISRKLYDDSANSWAETSIATSMLDVAASTCTPQFAITVDDANNKILLAAWSARDTANADLRFWSIDESSITEGTNIVLNSVDDQQMVALGLATDTAYIYAFYGGASDGSETAGTSINIYYKVSGDNGATWGAEQKITVSARNYVTLFTSLVFTGEFVAEFMFIPTAGPNSVLNTVTLRPGASSIVIGTAVGRATNW